MRGGQRKSFRIRARWKRQVRYRLARSSSSSWPWAWRLAFEFVNGFHDTANAVATVIYTNSLKPKQAVVWSGICNFLGVYFGGIGVGIQYRLSPARRLADQYRQWRGNGDGHGVAVGGHHLEFRDVVHGHPGQQFAHLDRGDSGSWPGELDDLGSRIWQRRELDEGWASRLVVADLTGRSDSARQRCCCSRPRSCCRSRNCTNRAAGPCRLPGGCGQS